MIEGNQSLFFHLLLLSLSSICMGNDLRKDNSNQIEISPTRFPQEMQDMKDVHTTTHFC